MAVIHISRIDAAGDFDGLMTRAANEDEILIESDARVVARLLPADLSRPRLLSESLRILKERGSDVTLDGAFGRDLEDIVNGHREVLAERRKKGGILAALLRSPLVGADLDLTRLRIDGRKVDLWPTLRQRMSFQPQMPTAQVL